MKQLKYIKSNGNVAIFLNYTIDLEGNVYHNNEPINIQKQTQGRDMFYINGKNYLVDRALASTFDEEHYCKGRIAKNGKWCKKKVEKEVSDKRKRPVVQYDMEGKQLAIFDSAKNASIATNIAASAITFVCRDKRKTAGGYVWKYFKK